MPLHDEVPDGDVDQFDSISNDANRDKTDAHGPYNLGVFLCVRFLALGQKLRAFLDEFQWSFSQFVNLVVFTLFSCFGHSWWGVAVKLPRFKTM